jgi:uncharacterized protein (DUF433 family)
LAPCTLAGLVALAIKSWPNGQYPVEAAPISDIRESPRRSTGTSRACADRQPCIRGLRFPVATVVAMLADGMGTEQILLEHPDLTAEDIRESLLYAAEAVRERELPLQHMA